MADSEDKKPEKKEGGEGSLNIRIRDQTGEETSKVKKTTKLDKVFARTRRARQAAATSLRFLFDDARARRPDARRHRHGGRRPARLRGSSSRGPLSAVYEKLSGYLSPVHW